MIRNWLNSSSCSVIQASRVRTLASGNVPSASSIGSSFAGVGSPGTLMKVNWLRPRS